MFKINKNGILSLASLALLLVLVIPAQAQVPDFFNFDDNYYTTYGGPDLEATIVGDNEFSRGDTVTLDINLMNKGVITGFESDEDVVFGDDLGLELQEQEMEYESQKTTAIGIVATLTSSEPNVKIKSGPQEAGSLRTGEQTEEPISFTIEISKNASAEDYLLALNLMYGCQENVQITGDEKTDNGIRNMEVGLWYEAMSQNVTIPISVEEEADFEIVNVTGELIAGEEGLVHVTYENTGEMPAKDATVRITVSDPFSTTDDQAFLGSIAPGENAVATFKLKVDDTATPKMYGITSEIKYEDVDGHDQISDTMKITIETQEASSGLGQSTGMILTLVGLVGVGGLGFVGYRKLKSNDSMEEMGEN